ncbi:LINE-1 retrotransposable element ORF2 protein [Linum grandiflorum]
MALWAMPSDKAPGPDGYTAAFYKASWGVVRGDFVDAVLSFFEWGRLPSFVNSVILTLIPKKSNAVDMKDFRPISCCNLVYKVISKILAKRLSMVLPELISAGQSAFIKGRLISDNILAAHELLRLYQRHKVSPRCAVKVDIMKAFDMVDWNFLLNVLRAMHFPDLFVHWIQLCLESTKMSVNINGTLCGYFAAKRGLRQGDPISPYLFVIAMEVLSCYFDQAATAGLFVYHPQCKRVKLTALCFADDLLVFTKASRESVVMLKNVLEEFRRCSGLCYNPEKTEMFLAGVTEAEKDDIVAASGFAKGSLPFRYLGVPLTAGKLKKHDCRGLLEKITSRISDWKSRLLSYAGRLQLLESVIGGILQYWMSIFLLPKSLLVEIELLCNRFLWGKQEGERCRMAWKSLAFPRKEGGCGLRELQSWNKANALRHLWNLMVRGGSLWVAWCYAYKIKTCSIWDVRSDYGSWNWKRIMKLRPLAQVMISYDDEGDPLWNGHYMPKFKLGDVWQSIRPRQQVVEWHDLIWSGVRIPSNSFIAWMVAIDRIPTREHLAAWAITIDVNCVLCDDGVDSRSHIFFECSYARRLLHFLFPMLGSLSKWEDVMQFAVQRWTGQSDNIQRNRLLWCAVVSEIWRQRCRRVFGEQPCDVEVLADRIQVAVLAAGR